MVDILSYDIYAKDKTDTSPGYSDTYNKLAQLSKNKLIALSECGKIPNPSDMLTAGWSYFMTWSGGFVDSSQNGGSDGSTAADENTADYLTTVYSDSKLLTLDKLGDWKSGGSGSSSSGNSGGTAPPRRRRRRSRAGLA